VSTCSFGCVYCQLGTIQHPTAQRQLFVPTAYITQELQPFRSLLAAHPAAVDVVTLSGSGEPTLALNLADIIAVAQETLARPVVVLTNGTRLGDPAVQAALQRADIVAAKVDAVDDRPLQGINRPVAGLDWAHLEAGLLAFAHTYPGRLAVQTMLLAPWPQATKQAYIDWVQRLQPQEIQLNIPRRPHALVRHLAARGNDAVPLMADALRHLKCVDREVLTTFAAEITAATGIPVRYPDAPLVKAAPPVV
jgi:wyosine [tRNA(Phe)-imidazoG37] synthetase (radical SAM superfamily)